MKKYLCCTYSSLYSKRHFLNRNKRSGAKVSSDTTYTQSDPDDGKSQSRHIVKIKPSVRVKRSSRVHKKKKPSRVRVKVMPRREGIEKQVRSSVGSPHSLQDSINISSLVDDYTSSIDSVIEDDSVVADDNISEILALLESARTRSQDYIENETVHENTLKPKNARTKRRPEKYY